MITSDENLFSLSYKIENIKRKLVSTYAHSTMYMLAIYCLVLYTLGNTIFATYIFGYLCVFLYTWMLIRKSYRIENAVRVHLMMGPFFIFIVFLFCKDTYTSALCSFLLPVPLAAYIFFDRKYVIVFTVYILLIIFLPVYLRKFIPAAFQFTRWKNQNSRIYSDIAVFAINIYVIYLLLYYKSKIIRLKTEYNILYERNMDDLDNIEFVAENEQYSIQNSNHAVINTDRDTEKEETEKADTEKYKILFKKVHYLVEEEKYFTKGELTISQLAITLKTNPIYLSKAIKAGSRFSNFNEYVNYCRISYVKKLIHEKDLNKVTLMYLYTEAGFVNQPTFNRVFKKFTGITPSEYINTIRLQEDNTNELVNE